MSKQVIKKKTQQIPAFLAGDHTRLREVLHPANDGVELGYSLAWAALAAGTASLPHRLDGNEAYYFLSGKGHMHVAGTMLEVETGDLVYVPPGALQWVENSGAGELVFLCIVSPAWAEEGEEVLPG